jgi:hypothetical protein
MYKNAQWQIYKHNLLRGDKYFINDPYYVDSIFNEESLSSFKLDYHGMKEVGDTIVFYFLFEKGAVPEDHAYFTEVSYPPSSNKIGINIYQRYGFFYPEDYKETEFLAYLKPRVKVVNKELRCLFTQ